MTEKITITEPTQLAEVNGLVHDYWFDLDEIEFDSEAATLSIQFSRPLQSARTMRWSLLSFLRRSQTPYVECHLRIHNVRDWQVADTAGVGFYDFNEICYAPDTRQIRIKTGVPLSLVIQVEKFRLSLEISDKVTEKRVHSVLVSRPPQKGQKGQ